MKPFALLVSWQDTTCHKLTKTKNNIIHYLREVEEKLADRGTVLYVYSSNLLEGYDSV